MFTTKIQTIRVMKFYAIKTIHFLFKKTRKLALKEKLLDSKEFV